MLFVLYRYKACKESAETLYARLATLSALQSYGFYLPSLMAAAAVASSSNGVSIASQHSLIRNPEPISGVDLSFNKNSYLTNNQDSLTGR